MIALFRTPVETEDERRARLKAWEESFPYQAKASEKLKAEIFDMRFSPRGRDISYIFELINATFDERISKLTPEELRQMADAKESGK